MEVSQNKHVTAIVDQSTVFPDRLEPKFALGEEPQKSELEYHDQNKTKIMKEKSQSRPKALGHMRSPQDP